MQMADVLFCSRFSVLEQKVTLVKLLQHFDFERSAQAQQKTGYTTEPCLAFWQASPSKKYRRARAVLSGHNWRDEAPSLHQHGCGNETGVAGHAAV